METARILELLPWRQPFLMIDRMVECVPHERILTRKNITVADLTGPEQTSAGFPAVLLLEGLSQSAALLFRLTYGGAGRAGLPLLGFLESSFRGSARPGETVLFEVWSRKMLSSGGLFQGRAKVGETVLVQGQLAFATAALPTAKGSTDQ